MASLFSPTLNPKIKNVVILPKLRVNRFERKNDYKKFSNWIKSSSSELQRVKLPEKKELKKIANAKLFELGSGKSLLRFITGAAISGIALKFIGDQMMEGGPELGEKLIKTLAIGGAVAGGTYAGFKLGKRIISGLSVPKVGKQLELFSDASKLTKAGKPVAKTTVKTALGRFGKSIIPGAGAVLGALDSAERAKEGDNTGAWISGTSAALDGYAAASAATGLGLPLAGLMSIASFGLDVTNLVRDLTGMSDAEKEKNKGSQSTTEINEEQQKIEAEEQEKKANSLISTFDRIVDKFVDLSKSLTLKSNNGNTQQQRRQQRQQRRNRSAGPAGPLKPSAPPTGEYDIIIPLDHVKPEMAGKFPDTNANDSFEQSRATGAAGRERDHQDNAAAKLKGKLEAKGYNVLVLKPESFSSYAEYDAYIRSQSAKGTRVVPLHFDAKVGQGGTGFLTRVRSGDAEDRSFASPIQEALSKFQKRNPKLGNLGPMDTVNNATVNAARLSPAALIELGAMVQWESEHGKNFTESDKFKELIQSVSDAIDAGMPKEVSQVLPEVKQKTIPGRDPKEVEREKAQALIMFQTASAQPAGPSIIPVPMGGGSPNRLGSMMGGIDQIALLNSMQDTLLLTKLDNA